MSELHKKYLSLKMLDSSKYYLFKNGFFYIFLDTDAEKMSNVLDLKLGNLNSKVVKCGFPEPSLSKYLNILKSKNFDIVVVPTSTIEKPIAAKNYSNLLELTSFASKISKIDVDSLSISNAFNLLSDLKEEATDLLKPHN